ncbi:hypothetical protein [Amycolatopsis sp. NPDC054798]
MSPGRAAGGTELVSCANTPKPQAIPSLRPEHHAAEHDHDHPRHRPHRPAALRVPGRSTPHRAAVDQPESVQRDCR